MKISLIEMGKTKKRSVREAIISILSRDYPLNVRRIYNQVKKEYALNVTYQAVFNMIKDMLAEGILEKNGMDYKLNTNWINQLKSELDVILNRYNVAEDEDTKKTQENVDKFVSELAPIIKNYIGKDEAAIVGISTGVGSVYAMAMWRHLTREGMDLKYLNYDPLEEASKPGINIEKKDVEGKKLIVIDAYIYSGRTYTATMKKFAKFKKKLRFKEIKFAVDQDKSGLAEFARIKG